MYDETDRRNHASLNGRATTAAATRCSNKLTIFTANIKILVNFQRKCVSAICTKRLNARQRVIRIARFQFILFHFIQFSAFLSFRAFGVVPWRCAKSKWLFFFTGITYHCTLTNWIVCNESFNLMMCVFFYSLHSMCKNFVQHA